MKWVYSAISVLVVGVLFFLFVPAEFVVSYEERVVRVLDASGNERARFIVDVADTQFKQIRGLSGRDTMPRDRGMLFVYDVPQVLTFWMKDMRFPIDIVWIRGQEIVGIEHDVQIPVVGEVLLRYSSSVPVDMVFEINAGLSEEFNIQRGDVFIIE